ncbi:MAG: acetolactate synthase small subunit [Clostridiales bacterium]|jgi:acetolactate synthase-1/3 small subunit|nr:acetolactate synthase small subunit [Clostridiales bacterium]
MDKCAISILVENNSGVLSRISGLFSRRGYNIHSLSVGVTEDSKFSRLTIITFGDAQIIEQICSQVKKLAEAVNVEPLPFDQSVFRELILVKVRAEPGRRQEIAGLTEIFRANIIDISEISITVELTGNPNKIKAFLSLMEPFGIIETARTGLTGILRGSSSIKDDVKNKRSGGNLNG